MKLSVSLTLDLVSIELLHIQQPITYIWCYFYLIDSLEHKNDSQKRANCWASLQFSILSGASFNCF